MEEVRPFGRSSIAGQQNAATLIALVNNIIQVLRRRRRQGLEPKVIQDEQVWAQIDVESAFPRTIGPTAVEMLQHLVDVEGTTPENLGGTLLGQEPGPGGFSLLPLVRR